MHAFARLDATLSSWIPGLLTHLWQSSLVALLILGILVVGRRLPARTRSMIGWIAVAKFGVPMAWVVGFLDRWREGRVPLAPDVLVLPVNLTATMASTTTEALAFPVVAVAVLAWLAGALGLLAWWLVRARRIRRRIFASAAPMPMPIRQALDRAATAAGLVRPPRGVMVERGHPPGVVGIFSPTVLLPRGLVEALSPGELAAVLLHECVHVRRRDTLATAGRAVFVATLWFNPVAWLVARVLAVEAEKACDEDVLLATGDASSYASGIVACVRHSLGLVPEGVSAATTPPVLGRIRAILAFDPRAERRASRRAAVWASLTLAGVSGFAGSVVAGQAEAPKPAAPQTNAPKPETAKSTARRVSDITIVFTAATNASEAFVRSQMELRVGDVLDEATLDRSIRALYRTNQFETITTKVMDAPDGTCRLSFFLDPKSSFDGVAPADPSAAPGSGSNPVQPKRQMTPEELADARAKLLRSRERLEQLRAERAALEQKRQETKQSEAGSTTASGPLVVTSAAAKEMANAPASTRQPTAVWDGQPVYDISELDRQPAPRFQAAPRYPFELRRAGVTGEVVVDFIVDRQGDVVNAFALRSSNAGFDAAAVDAVSRWKFKPGVKSGNDVSTHLQVPVVFTISQ